MFAPSWILDTLYDSDEGRIVFLYDDLRLHTTTFIL